MSGAIPHLPQYAFMARCSLKKGHGQLYLFYLYYVYDPSFCILRSHSGHARLQSPFFSSVLTLMSNNKIHIKEFYILFSENYSCDWAGNVILTFKLIFWQMCHNNSIIIRPAMKWGLFLRGQTDETKVLQVIAFSA